MQEKLPIAALVLAGIALLMVLMTSAPEAPRSDSVASVERIVLMVSSESDAAAEDQQNLEIALANIAEMRGRFDENKSGGGPDPSKYAKETTQKELKDRWKEFDSRLSVINNVRKSRPKK